jgi:hypothetical protein
MQLLHNILRKTLKVLGANGKNMKVEIVGYTDIKAKILTRLM